MRSTFEARGYTAWDPTSPPWLLSNPNGMTLVIPTAFVSWTGEALDKKTPLLRSMEALSSQAVRILKLFGSRAERVVTTCGPEQEYFLIDSHFYFARPDLINAGRTLFGAKPPKGQELEDQYFGAIPERVLACMMEVETELVQGRRPGQDAPQRGGAEPVRDRADLRERQRRHRPPDDGDGDAAPHRAEVRPRTACCTRSRSPASTARASTSTGRWATTSATTCCSPGDNPHDNVQFLVFCAAVLRAVHKSQGLLRAAIASAGNDHRLGANEAPPAIISVFLGDMLTDIFEQIEKGAAKSTKSGGILETGVSVLPKLPRDAGDRNRTSPFAFTGNKFEFRAVSSGQSIAMPNICLNVAVADSLAYVADELEKATAGGQSLDAAVGKLLTKMIKESKPIIFNGNNYSAEWEKEAAKRKLLNLKNTVDALPELVTARRRSRSSRRTRCSTRARSTRATRSCSSSTSRRSTSRRS